MREAGDPSFRFQLRQSTAAAHRQLEAVIGLETRVLDRNRYRDLLAMFWGYYAPLETALARVDWRGSGVDFASRAKLPWLDEDLVALGWPSATVAALPQAPLKVSAPGVAEGLGVLYVVEGSTLGGQTILPKVHEALGLTPGSGARFFASYGPQVGRMWRDFVSALEHAGEDPETASRIERAALAAFDDLITWAEAALAPNTGMKNVG